MLLVLFPFFLLTAAMLGGGAYFVATFLFPELPTRKLKQIRTALLAAILVCPVLYFGLYMMAQPKEPGDPEVAPADALIPATWLACLLAGAAFGLVRAIRRRGLPSRVRAPAS